MLFGGFDRAVIELTADTLRAFLIGLVAHALIAVLARAFYALHDTRTPVAVAVLAVVINTTLAVALVEPLGPARHRPRHRHRRLARGDAPAAPAAPAGRSARVRGRRSGSGCGSLLATAIAGLAGLVAHDKVGPRAGARPEPPVDSRTCPA